MRFSIPASLILFAGLALAEWKNIPSEGYSLAERGLLVERACFSGMTCSECWGKGNVICAQVACFNPTIGEQCCEDGSFCVAKNNSCCNPLRPGVTGTDGVPLPTDSVTATATGSLSAPSPSASGWTCTRADSGEECCQRGGSFLHWCSGSFPNNRCYNPSSQTCCSEGTVCEGENCCDIVSAVPTTPYATGTTSQPGKTSTSSAATTKITQAGPALVSPTTTTAPTSTAGAVAAVTNAISGAAAVALGVIGLALL